MMFKAPFFILAAVASAMSALSSAHATVITFDDASSTTYYDSLPYGYAGLNWDTFSVVNKNASGLNPSGYLFGNVSGNYEAFNLGGGLASFSSDSPITLNSAYFTGAWYDGLTIQVKGYAGNTLAYTTSFEVSTTASKLVTFNWINIDTVSFSAYGGANTANYPGDGTHFVMDNLTINAPVPEADAYLLTLSGILAAGMLARRRKLG